MVPETELMFTTLRKTSRPSSRSCLAGSRRCGLELVVGHLVDGPVPRVAGVVDEDVELAPFVDHALDHLVGHARVREVAGEGDGLARDFSGSLLGHVAVEVVDEDACSLLGQELGRGAADAACASGDDGHLPVENAHLQSPSGCSRRAL
jgi:hypothetical protein